MVVRVLALIHLAQTSVRIYVQSSRSNGTYVSLLSYAVQGRALPVAGLQPCFRTLTS